MTPIALALLALLALAVVLGALIAVAWADSVATREAPYLDTSRGTRRD